MIIAIAKGLSVDEFGLVKTKGQTVHFQPDSEMENDFVDRIMRLYNEKPVDVAFYRADFTIEKKQGL